MLAMAIAAIFKATGFLLAVTNAIVVSMSVRYASKVLITCFSVAGGFIVIKLLSVIDS